MFTDLFIKKPVLAISINLLILLIGLSSIHRLNVRQYPKSDSAVLIINTAYVGANADLVRGFITTPMERAIASADGIDYLESSSAQSLSTIRVNLRLNYNVNDALTQVQSKINQVRNDLPPEAEAPIIEVQSKDSPFAAMYISFYSDTLDQNQITDYLTRVIQPKLSAVTGVQRAEILGDRTFAMRVWLKSDQMASLNISPAEVRAALSANNSLSAIGNTKGSYIQVNLTANTDLKTKEEFENLVIRQDQGNVIRLKEIAKIELGAQNYEQDVRFGGKKATFMGIYVLPNSNSLDVIKSIRQIFPEIQKTLPSGLQANISYDSTTYISDALHEVFKTLGETIIIVMIVIYLFIGSFRSVLVPLVAIPLSLVGSCALMLALGFTLNLLTILAIVLAVGLVVDDAIVMLENVERHISEGMLPFDAAIRGARELFTPTIAMTITLAAVYAPLGFQGGLTGALFKEFAFTLSSSVVISGIVALSLSPMMSSKLLHSQKEIKGFEKFLSDFFEGLKKRYSALLEGTIRYRPVTIFAGLVLSLLVIPFYLFSFRELAPKEDQGVVFGIVQAPPNASLDQTMLYASQLDSVYRKFPEWDQTFQIIGPTGGFSGMVVKPWGERKRTTIKIAEEAPSHFESLTGIQTIITTPDPLPGGSDFPVEFMLTTTAEPIQLLEYANQLVGSAFQSGKFIFADTNIKFDLPQSRVILDRDKISSMGLNLQQVSGELGSMFGGNYVNRFSIMGRSYKVIPQTERSERLNPDQIKDIYIRGPEGKMVPLSTFATIQNSVEPRQLNRFQQQNTAKIYGVPRPGVTLDQALAVLEKKAKEILPNGFNFDYAGGSRQLRTEGNSLLETFILAILLIYLVLAAQFESFRDPLIIILGSVPLALSGAMLFVFLGVQGSTINIYTQVGLITLVGLVSKNGILIVEFANKLQEEGRTKLEAVKEAAGTRLRPILMTSAATVFGHLPLVFVTGAGAAARNNIGIVLVTGMTIGTLFTLFIVPSIYLVLAADRRPQSLKTTSG
jgi:multidrug efflux pump